MAARVSLVLLGLAAPLLLVAGLLPGVLGEPLFAVCAAVFPWALAALGATRGGRLGRPRWPLVALAAWYLGCVVAILALRGSVTTAPWIGGLPLVAAIQLYGLFLLPLPAVGLLYALTFADHGVDDRTLETLRAAGTRAAGDDAAGRDDGDGVPS